MYTQSLGILVSLQKISGKLAAKALLIVNVEYSLNEFVVLGTEADTAIEDITDVVTDQHPFVKQCMYSKESPDEPHVPLSEQACP